MMSSGKCRWKTSVKAGMDTSFVFQDKETPSGVALITVDRNAENAIVVAPGANAKLHTEDVDQARDAVASADAVLLQFEIPAETVVYTMVLAKSLGRRVVLNPAPIRPFHWMY